MLQVKHLKHSYHKQAQQNKGKPLEKG